MGRVALVAIALCVVSLSAGHPNDAAAQSQGAHGSIADNDSILIDGTTFTVTSGKAIGDASGMIKVLGARKLGPGALVFRSGGQLYIVDTFLVVVFGGAQSLIGTIASALTISQSQSTLEFFLTGSIAKVLTLLIVIAILMIRPQGLFVLKVRR